MISSCGSRFLPTHTLAVHFPPALLGVLHPAPQHLTFPTPLPLFQQSVSKEKARQALAPRGRPWHLLQAPEALHPTSFLVSVLQLKYAWLREASKIPAGPSLFPDPPLQPGPLPPPLLCLTQPVWVGGLSLAHRPVRREWDRLGSVRPNES